MVALALPHRAEEETTMASSCQSSDMICQSDDFANIGWC